MFSPQPEKSSALDDLVTGIGTVLGHAAAGAATGYAADGLNGARAGAVTGAAAGVVKVVRDAESPSLLAKLGSASAALCVAVIASKLGGDSEDARPTLR